MWCVYSYIIRSAENIKSEVPTLATLSLMIITTLATLSLLIVPKSCVLSVIMTVLCLRKVKAAY